VQVDPIKPTLKAPGTKRLKLNYDAPLSSFAFKLDLRRYREGSPALRGAAAALYEVGRFRLTLSNPRRKRLQLSS
jgi:hypothetical protein